MTTTTTDHRRDRSTVNVAGPVAARLTSALDDLGFPDVETGTYSDRVTVSLDLPDARRLEGLLRGVGS